MGFVGPTQRRLARAVELQRTARSGSFAVFVLCGSGHGAWPRSRDLISVLLADGMLRTGHTVGRLQTYLLSVGTSEWRYVMMLSVLNHVNTYCVPDLV